MEPMTIERYLNEPGLAERLHAEARRERAVYLYRFAKALIERFTPRRRTIHWIARLG